MLDAIDGSVLGVLQDWDRSGCAGASSRAIAAHLAGYGETSGAYPRDAVDFQRCEGLMKEIPAFRDNLSKMAEVNAYWAALVPRWDEIAASPDADGLIKSILDPLHRRDSSHFTLSPGVSVRMGQDPINTVIQDGLAKDRARRKSPPTKHDREFAKMETDAKRVTREELRQFVERYERLEQEKKDIADAQKEVMAEAKGRGYDTKVLRKIVALRKRDPQDVSEEEAVIELYKEALGM